MRLTDNARISELERELKETEPMWLYTGWEIFMVGGGWDSGLQPLHSSRLEQKLFGAHKTESSWRAAQGSARSARPAITVQSAHLMRTHAKQNNFLPGSVH